MIQAGLNMLGKHNSRAGNARGLATPIDVDLQKEYAFEVSVQIRIVSKGER